jgi:hypothetical protein
MPRTIVPTIPIGSSPGTKKRAKTPTTATDQDERDDRADIDVAAVVAGLGQRHQCPAHGSPSSTGTWIRVPVGGLSNDRTTFDARHVTTR